MIRLVNFASPNMTQSQKLCCESALKHDVNDCFPQNVDTITHEFIVMNGDIFRQPRGFGYWLWKPYFIYKSMLHCQEGDILIYADAGIEFVNSVSHIIDRMDQDIFFFTNGFPQLEWCKMDCIKAILGNHYYTTCNDKQVQASCIFFKVNQATKDFVKEWLLYCQMPGFIDDSPSKIANFPTFAEHRHDQAILTCLQIKYGYKLHFWPTVYSEHIRHTAQPGDTYPTIFNHHRKRNAGTETTEPTW